MRPERQTWLSERWLSEAESRRWLSGLIVAMEEAARPELRREAIPAETLAEFRAHLALPASFRTYQTSVLRH